MHPSQCVYYLYESLGNLHVLGYFVLGSWVLFYVHITYRILNAYTAILSLYIHVIAYAIVYAILIAAYALCVIVYVLTYIVFYNIDP